MGGIWLVEVLGQILNPDDQVGIGSVICNVGHDGNKHMLFLGKGTWVEGMAHTEESDAIVREPPFETLANWI